MKVLSTPQIRACDAHTIAHEPIPSVDLMERASRQLYYWFKEHVDRSLPVHVFCGKGNNGGDGLALSRMLLLTGWKVRTYIVEHSEKSSEDFDINLKRLQDLKSSIFQVNSDSTIDLEHGVLVDAILGSGLNAPLKGMLKEVVDELNTIQLPKISVDIPTGLYADALDAKELGAVFEADATLCFQCPKLSFLVPETGQFAGDFYVLDIGLNQSFVDDQETQNFYTDKIQLKPKTKFDHKGSNGHALLVTGSKGKIGAGLLSASAALRAGAGLVTAYIPACGVVSFQSALAEVMVLADQGESRIENIAIEGTHTAIGIGPGLGTHESTKEALFRFLGSRSEPLVLDADALNILSTYDAWDLVPENSILTPHPGEFKRMSGANDGPLFEQAREFAVKTQLIVVLKGANTAVCLPNGEVHFNATGNPGMATAGSGDVLTGIITGLLAQQYSPEEAAINGVFMHGLAGDMALKDNTFSTLNASSIIENLHLAFDNALNTF